MNTIKNKEIWISGFALFSLFFGAGNLILPPFLGVKSGQDWFWVALGFTITAVVIPMLGIIAHAKLQGTLYDLGKKVSPWFSSVFCILIYLIAITLPAPRTASVTHEITIAPFLGTSPWVTSSVYFLVTFVFVMNRSRILSLIGKLLTPAIVIILISIIFTTFFSSVSILKTGSFKTPLVAGALEGYQTFDAIGSIVVGAVIIVSLNLKGYTSYQAKKQLIIKAGLIAAIGLLFIYGGLIFSGATLSSSFSDDATRPEILTGISNLTLGYLGTFLLSILVALACFTTCVGIITGAADYVKSITNNSQKAYIITAAISCLIGIVLGSYSVTWIIQVAVPALLFMYPITIVLIVLNVLPKRWASSLVFKVVVIATFVFSIPDFLSFFIDKDLVTSIKNVIPFSKNNLGWVLPSLISFTLTNFYLLVKKATLK